MMILLKSGLYPIVKCANCGFAWIQAHEFDTNDTDSPEDKRINEENEQDRG